MYSSNPKEEKKIFDIESQPQSWSKGGPTPPKKNKIAGSQQRGNNGEESIFGSLKKKAVDWALSGVVV
jgi:hypothetical protein